jgi:tRNA wybutosine-synthesizing protein 3
MATSLSQAFLNKKAKILSSLSIPSQEYDDLSPKGSIDEGIIPLIEEINGYEGLVTTSSCAGRVSVFLEGRRQSSSTGDETNEEVSGARGENGDEEENEVKNIGGGEERDASTTAGTGGKGGGGRWLFVSHDPLPLPPLAESHSWIETLGMGELDEAERVKIEEKMGDVKERRLIHFKFEPVVLLPPSSRDSQ